MRLVHKAVREVAGAAPRDPDLVPDGPGVLEEDDRPAPLSALDGATKTRGARADNDHVFPHEGIIPILPSQPERRKGLKPGRQDIMISGRRYPYHGQNKLDRLGLQGG